MNVPLLDLAAQFEAIRDEVLPPLLDVVESQRFIMGEPVGELETALANFLCADHAIACASGTDALLLSLRALKFEPGDEVITTPFTFFATAGAIHNAGGRPVFVDIDPNTFNLDVAQVGSAISGRTRAVVPVHLFGQMAPMEELLSLANQHDLAVIEDGAQAIGARQKIGEKWRMAGELGLTGAFSFFPSKNLGGWGDGGLIVTQDADIAERLRKLRTHGGAKQYHHEEVGTNSRLDTLQAAVLLAKLPHLEEWNAVRRAHADTYSDAFEVFEEVIPPTTDLRNEHVFNQYTVRVNRRDDLRAFLNERGVGSAIYYPKPLHLQACFAHLGYSERRFPEAEKACSEVLSLPVYPEMSTEQQDMVIDSVREFYQ